MPNEERLPAGARRDLVAALHDLYALAGKPAARTISTCIRDRDDLPGTLSHEGVSAVLRGSGGVPRWPNLESLVRVLVDQQRISEVDVEAEIRRIHNLWRLADGASPSGQVRHEISSTPQQEPRAPRDDRGDGDPADQPQARDSATTHRAIGDGSAGVPNQLPLARWNPRLRTLDILDRQMAIEIIREVSADDH
jgi:hypothetical protein